MGTWGNRNDGQGVYLNLERYYGPSAAPGRVWLSACITTSQVATLNSAIRANNSWSKTNNCASFTAKVWNAVVPDMMVSAGTPNTPNQLANSIKGKSYVKDTPYTTVSKASVARLLTDNTRITATI